ncbi:PRD domain-containing protein [Enterococcus faecium]|nr:PRD domain-containing protein [Enterococcus faecium]
MKVVKKINNNIALCLDNSGHELIAVGKGIGFPPMPYVLKDLDVIDRTYYDVDQQYLPLLKELPDEIIGSATEIVDLVRLNIPVPITSNLIFSLADHIQFSVERVKKGIIIEAPLYYDIQHLHKREFDLGKQGLAIINKHTGVWLPVEEASNLALHFLNAESANSSVGELNYSQNIIEEVTNIIAGHFEIYIDRNSFNFSRFATHLQYLLKRQVNGKAISSGNQRIMHSMEQEYPKTKTCVDKIAEYLNIRLQMELNEDEILYLMLHVNRICNREDCHQ